MGQEIFINTTKMKLFFVSILLVSVFVNSIISAKISENSKKLQKVTTEKTLTNETCKQLEIQADKEIKTVLLISQKDPIIPRNVVQMKEHCRHGEEAISIGKKYSKCLGSFPKQILLITLKNVKKVVKSFCGKKINTTLFYLKCITNENIGTFYELLNSGIKRLDYISESVEDNQMIPHLCCTFHVIFSDLLKTVNLECKNNSEGTANLVKKIIDSIAGDPLDLACGKFPDLDTCHEKMPEVTANIITNSANETDMFADRLLLSSIINIATRLSS